MSEIRHKRSTQSNPALIRQRLEKARAEGRDVEIDKDEVTSVIDIALQMAREAGDAGQQKVRELARTLDSCVAPPSSTK